MKHKQVESKYNPPIPPKILERVFGYSRSTIYKWEEPSNNSRPQLAPSKIIEHPTNSSLNRKFYSVEDIKKFSDHFRSMGELSSVDDNPVSMAVWNNKGGVGKSVFTKELAFAFSALMGYKVLVIDTDSQSDTTLNFNCIQVFNDLIDDDDEIQPTLREVIGYEDVENNTYKVNVHEAIIDLSPTLSIIPSNEEVSDLDFDLRLLKNIEITDAGQDLSQLVSIKLFLESLKDQYDIVIFDCAPNKSTLNLNILYACDRLIIPVEIEAKCIHSLSRVFQHLNTLKTELSEEFEFEKILAVPNKFKMGQVLNQRALVKLQEVFGDHILSNTVIHSSADIDNSGANKESIFMRAFDSKSSIANPRAKRAANCFWEVAHEILDLKQNHLLFPEVVD